MASNFEAKTGADLMFNTLVEYILTTDSVLGDQADLLDSSNFGGKINEVLQAFFDNLNYLKAELDGIGTIPTKASQTEARTGTNDVKFITALRLLDFIRNGTSVIATESRKGTLEIADQSQRRAGSSNALALTPAGILDALRNSGNFEANESRKGVSQRASLSDVTTGTEDNEFVTPKLLNDADFLRAQTSQATLSVSTGTITIRKNLQIDDLVFMVVENTGTGSIGSGTTWTLGGGAWRVFSVNLVGEPDNRMSDPTIDRLTENTSETTWRGLSLDQNQFARIIVVLQ